MTKEEAVNTLRLLSGLRGTTINGRHIYALMVAPYGGEHFNQIHANFEKGQYHLNNPIIEQYENLDIYVLSEYTDGIDKGKKQCAHIEVLLEEIFTYLKQ
jgi:hypothetical protein